MKQQRFDCVSTYTHGDAMHPHALLQIEGTTRSFGKKQLYRPLDPEMLSVRMTW
jgi:hypothetical protein